MSHSVKDNNTLQVFKCHCADFNRGYSENVLPSLRRGGVGGGGPYGENDHIVKRSLTRGRIFSHVRPFNERAVSDLDP